jgi:hypothetical protein
MFPVITREKWRAFIDLPVVEWTIFALGVLLILLSPLAGVIPGPGGILVFGLGLAMVLKTSMWAKRHYVRFKRKQPKAARWVDWGLRRRSALRREAQRRQEMAQDSHDPANIGQAPVQPPGATPVEVPNDPWPERSAPSN